MGQFWLFFVYFLNLFWFFDFFSNMSNLNYRCMEYCNVVFQKMLFMLIGACWVPIHELALNFAHLLRVTWWPTCRKSVLKLYKIHTMSENHETWRCLGFRHPTSQLAWNLLNFLSQPTHAITWHLDKFRHFRTSYGLYIILKHFFGKWLVMLREEDARNLMRVRG